jgi:hypothetical protein
LRPLIQETVTKKNMKQDFSRKIAIVIREDISSWKLTNVVGHIAAYLGNKIPVPFNTGEYFVSKDNLNFPRNSQFSIVVLRGTQEKIKNLVNKLQNSHLLWVAYIQEMMDLVDDEELANALSCIVGEEMNILGVGVFGLKEELKILTDGLELWE